MCVVPGSTANWDGGTPVRSPCPPLLTSLTISRALDYRLGLSWALDGFAQLALARDAPRPAIQLASAAAWVREEAGLRLSPPEQAKFDSLREDVTARIGADAVATVWANRRESVIDDLVRTVRDHLR
jgi:hypothetical protein